MYFTDAISPLGRTPNKEKNQVVIQVVEKTFIRCITRCSSKTLCFFKVPSK